MLPHKDQIRKLMRVKLRELDLNYKRKCDELLQAKLLKYIADNNHKNVLLYYPLQGEPDIRLLISTLQQNDVTVCIPHSDKIAIGKYTAPQDLKFDKRKVASPNNISSDLPTLAVLPGLAFSKSNFRLGHGSGWYDRYLANNNVYTVGVCYDIQLIDRLDTQPHDKALDELWVIDQAIV